MKHVLGFSGGIDSEAAYVWLRERYAVDDIILLNSTAGQNEHPITTEFLLKFSEEVHPVEIVDPIVGDLQRVGSKGGVTKQRREEFADDDPLRFDTLAYIKQRFPSMRSRFCTHFLKLMPQVRWMKKNLDERGIEYVRYTGIRREESPNRAKREPEEHDEVFGCTLRHPILDWKKQECFDVVEAAGLPINELYRLGFTRVGCAPCVNSSKGDISRWASRFPEMIDKVRDWEKRVGRTFFPPCVPGLEINWIDEVVRWAKTLHGGKQFDLLQVIDPPVCESDFGLCE